MFDYAELAQVAAGLLAEFGQTATLLSAGAGGYDPAALSHTAQTAEYRGKAAGFAYKSHEIDGHLVLSGDVKIYLERIAVVPKVGDKIVLSGKTWRIMQVSPIAPAGFDVVYVLQGRL